jgi:hypothetical protein
LTVLRSEAIHDEGANDPTMKKLTIVFALVIAGVTLLTSCSKGHGCPAYGKVNPVPAEHRS